MSSVFPVFPVMRNGARNAATCSGSSPVPRVRKKKVQTHSGTDVRSDISGVRSKALVFAQTRGCDESEIREAAVGLSLERRDTSSPPLTSSETLDLQDTRTNMPVPRQPVSMKPTCSYAARRIQEESRLQIEYTQYRKGALEHMSFGIEPPLCDRCLVNPSSMRCLDCSRGGYSLCESCHPVVHNSPSALSHIIEHSEASTGGYSRIAPAEREVLIKPACPYCGSRYGVGVEEVRMEKTLSTLRNGDVAITVLAWQCPKCQLPVGVNASTYCCVAANGTRWFERELLEVLDDFDSACEFSTTNKSSSNFCRTRSRRAKSTATPPPENVLLDAMRIYRSLRDEEATGDLGGELGSGGTPLGLNLVECPACKQGTKPLSMNFDGCFKLNQLQSADAFVFVIPGKGKGEFSITFRHTPHKQTYNVRLTKEKISFGFHRRVGYGPVSGP